MFCMQCKRSLCMECFESDEHAEHILLTMKNARERCRSERNRVISSLKGKEDETDKNLAKLKEREIRRDEFLCESIERIENTERDLHIIVAHFSKQMITKMLHQASSIELSERDELFTVRMLRLECDRIRQQMDKLEGNTPSMMQLLFQAGEALSDLEQHGGFQDMAERVRQAKWGATERDALVDISEPHLNGGDVSNSDGGCDGRSKSDDERQSWLLQMREQMSKFSEQSSQTLRKDMQEHLDALVSYFQQQAPIQLSNRPFRRAEMHRLDLPAPIKQEFCMCKHSFNNSLFLGLANDSCVEVQLSNLLQGKQGPVKVSTVFVGTMPVLSLAHLQNSGMSTLVTLEGSAESPLCRVYRQSSPHDSY